MERYEAITLTSIALFERIVFMLIVEWFPLLLSCYVAPFLMRIVNALLMFFIRK